MASTSASQRSRNAVAFATALLIHGVFLTLLIQVRPVPPLMQTWEDDIPPPAFDVSLMPRAGAAAGAPGDGLRRLDDAPTQASAAQAAAAQPQSGAGLRGATAPSEATASLAPSPPSLQIAPPPTLTSPAAPPELRPVQTPSIAEPPAPAPVLAAREPPVQFSPPPVLTRPATPADLAAPERPLPMLATRPPALSIEAPPQLRPAQPPELRSLDRPLPMLAAQPPPLQVAAPSALEGPARLPQLRSAQAPSIAAPQAPAPPVLVAQPPLRLTTPGSVTNPATSPGLAPPQRLASGAGVAGPDQSGLAAAGSAGAAAAQGSAGAQSGSQVAGAGAAGRSGAAHPGCAREDLILLTAEEQVRCREQLAAEAARRARPNGDVSRRLQQALAGPRIDRIDPGKRAWFDASMAAREAARAPGGGRSAGLACNLSSLFGGPSGLPAEKVKIPGLPCVFVPPTGVLTEESRISPP